MLALLLTLLTLPVWADGYLSRYGGGGGQRYLSEYSSGSYSPGHSGGYVGYGGSGGGIERKHRASWEAYQRRLAHPEYATIYHGPYYNTWAYREYLSWFNVSPAAGRPLNRNRVYGGTTRYDPALHGAR